MVRLSLLALAAVAHFSYAWLPSDGSRKLLDTRGFSLFDSQNTSTIDDSDDIGKRWWTASGKIRGVNLGSLFVFEPWIANGEWNNIGCGGQQSEFDCVMNTGQERSDAAFQKHWDTWITEGDLDEMMGYGINTIRIPLGYWLDETLVDKNSEHFPRSPGFYNDYQYGRSIKFLEFLRKLAHDHSELRNVGTIQLVNEPTNWDSSVQSLRSTFYKNAYNAIRKVERDLGVTPNNYVHIQMMSSLWGSGNPVEFLDDTYFTAFDDHRYLKWANKNDVPWTHESYISTSCADNRNGDAAGPTIVGEWSISPPDEIESSDGWNRNTQKDFYRRWFAAQVLAYERSTAGWVFWTWKAQLNDYRWSYRGELSPPLFKGW
ncbi:endo-beta1,6-glucanase [Colletotrichum higginsianum]|nr:endo-beta1,6-glucanase [Colletotrichum higginsianum]